MIKIVELSEAERQDIRAMLLQIKQDSQSVDETWFLEHCPVFAHELPRRIRSIFHDFRTKECPSCILVKNNPITSEDISPTPSFHRRRGEIHQLKLGQFLHGLYMSLLGEPFGFRSQQNGRVFNDLIPIQNCPANSSSGHGDVGFHTEDCIQPFMPDYLGFLCLRNEEKAKTKLSSITELTIPEETVDVLFQNIFPRFKGSNKVPDSGQQGMSALFGDRARPYLRYGSFNEAAFTPAAHEALSLLSAQLKEKARTVILEQGDCLYVDNFYTVHGRVAYEPRYDGTGRWFCRLVANRDLRKLRTLRESPECRIISG